MTHTHKWSKSPKLPKLPPNHKSPPFRWGEANEAAVLEGGKWKDINY